uniref:hypothetical protein n=1 Tax=Agathobacter sp. TaxID=2021311 RepID=UPI0040570363
MTKKYRKIKALKAVFLLSSVKDPILQTPYLLLLSYVFSSQKCQKNHFPSKSIIQICKPHKYSHSVLLLIY